LLIITLCHGLFRFVRAYIEDDFKGRLSAWTLDPTIVTFTVLTQILWVLIVGPLVLGPLPEVLPREYALVLSYVDDDCVCSHFDSCWNFLL
jgi:hypothetical protein